MPVSDDIKKEQQKTKDMSLKGKLSYFWYYYKVHTLVAIFGTFFIVALVRDILSNKDYGFYGVYFNAQQTFSAEEQMDAFTAYANIDTENYQALLDNTMYYSLTDMSETTIATSQKFAALTHTGQIDCVVADEDVFANYAVNGVFFDLRDVLPEDLLEKYKDNIFYIDLAQAVAMEDTEAAAQYYNEEEYYMALAEKYSEHRDPSLMEDPIPVGIIVTDTPVISSAGCYMNKIPVFGIPASTTRSDVAIRYLRFLHGE